MECSNAVGDGRRRPWTGDEAMQPLNPSGGAGGFPVAAESQRILALSDLTLRNLFITQGYHELSGALSRMLGSSANWCTFATWASKQAGQTIRREDLERFLEHEIRTVPGGCGWTRSPQRQPGSIRGSTLQGFAE